MSKRRLSTSDKAKTIFGDPLDDSLYQKRARAALPILVRQALAGEPIVYEDLAKELKMPNPRNLNFVLGSIGNTLSELGEKWPEKIPPIQALVVNKETALPGEGVHFFDEKMDLSQKKAIVRTKWEEVYKYQKWLDVLDKLGIQNDRSRVLEKITEIVIASATGDYIYRGEPECHDKVCSNLYRIRPDTDGIHFDIADFQENMLEEARAYLGETDNIEETDVIGILTELQHFGGKTNLIDFTKDYLIALYFACDGSPDEKGRVILLKRESETDDYAYAIRRPRRTINRVESQRSVFVESSTGFVEPDIEIPIPAELKQPILDYLRECHRISVETIYSDLHGFIRRGPYAEYLKGLASQRNAEEAKTRDEKYRHYDNAIRHYTEAIALKPNFANAYNNLAIAYRHKRDFDAAIRNCNKSIELKPDFAEAYLNRGNAYAGKDKFDIAIQDFSKSIELKSDYARAYNNRGTVYCRIGEVDAAIRDHNKAIELNPNFARAYDSRGIDYYRKNRFDRAIQDHNKAIELNPEYAEAYNNRGTAYHHKGNLEEAIQNYSKAIELNPEYAEAYNHRGAAYHHKGNLEEAIQNYSKAIELNPEYANAYTNRGETWLHISEWEKARADLTTARDMGFDIVASFHNDYESVEDFEAQHGVKVPEDIAALLSRDFETVETKPLVLTEGPSDVRYIQRALDVLGRGELLNSLDIEFVGIVDEKGTRFGGDTGLNRFRDIYEANSSLYHRPILLLYDCDTQKPNEQIEKLWVRSIPKNEENTKVKKGIENLFPTDLFREDFYSEAPTDDGGYAKRLDKSKFCDWICENGTAIDFAKFDSVVQILQEFLEANYLPPRQL